jgi:hypothetical protein
VSSPSPVGRRSRRRARLVGLGVGLLMVVAFSSGAADHPPPPPGVWVLTRNTATVVFDIDRELAGRFFGVPHTFVLHGWGGATTAMSWANYDRFAAAIADGTIPQGVRAVMYDPEDWNHTPIREQQDPAVYMRAFARLAHEHGYLVILTPHPNLAAVQGAWCKQRVNETIQSAYLRCGFAGMAARYADVLDVQAQFLEGDVGAYRSLVMAAAAQARVANPRVVVLSHLSTAYALTPEVLYEAWASVSDVVDGHYLGAPDGVGADTAAAFLRMLEANP